MEISELNFGTNLKRYLLAYGITQKELAVKSGLTQAAVSQIVNGYRDPQLSTICAILRVMPVSFEKLISFRK